MNSMCLDDVSMPASTDRDELIALTIRRCGQLATLPEIALKIVRIVDDPDATLEDLEAVIQTDPSLGMRILKLVNSAYYGMSGEVKTINRAVLLIGLKAVKNIAIAASLIKLFRGKPVSKHFSPCGLWTHSLAVAIAAQMLAKESGLVAADEAFLAGLIHDVGIMVELQSSGPQFDRLLQEFQEAETLTFREAEKQVFGASHEEFGAGLCRIWNLHPSFQYVTGFHHRPHVVPASFRQLPLIVHIADIVAARLSLGYSQTVETDWIDPKHLDEVSLRPEQLASITARLPEAIKQGQQLLEGQ